MTPFTIAASAVTTFVAKAECAGGVWLEVPGAGRVGAPPAASLGGTANAGQVPVGRRNPSGSQAWGCSGGPC